MGFETTKIDTVQSSILAQNKSQKKSTNISTLQDDILGIKKEDKKKTEEKKDENKNDQVQLSDQAIAILNGTAPSGSKTTGQPSKSQLEVAALEFRGLTQAAQARDLTPKEEKKFTDIKQAFADIGVNDKGILKIAEKRLVDLQSESVDLVQLLNNNQITGGQFNKLNNINTLLNKSNGFGSDQVEGALQVKTDQLTKQFNDIVSQTKDQKLSRDNLSNLDQLQRQISSIQGYQLNVRDTVGPDGLVI